ncbi:MAG: hypothetical protein CM15mV71_390 [Caudoviricetes sp.]|nr:MAG: hypothetical protein CM15mV71_390 [Caudoviricetes sp.]
MVYVEAKFGKKGGLQSMRILELLIQKKRTIDLATDTQTATFSPNLLKYDVYLLNPFWLKSFFRRRHFYE